MPASSEGGPPRRAEYRDGGPPCKFVDVAARTLVVQRSKTADCKIFVGFGGLRRAAGPPIAPQQRPANAVAGQKLVTTQRQRRWPMPIPPPLRACGRLPRPPKSPPRRRPEVRSLRPRGG